MEKRRKPEFKRNEWNKKPRFNSRAKKRRWRRARGLDSKTRLKIKGHRVSPTIGYGMPKEIRGLINGLNPVMINKLADLDMVGKKDIAVVSANLGARKRVDLANRALKLNLKFDNFNPENFLKKIEESKAKKKSREKPADEKKTDKKDESKKGPEQEEKKEAKEDAAEKKIEENSK